MTPVPFDLPLRPSEAGALAELIFEYAEGKKLTEELRNRLAGRAATIAFESLTPYLGSVERDPVHPSSYYVAVDGAVPLLLHIAPAAAPTPSLYPKSLLIGRMRTMRGREILINAAPFAAGDHENVRQYAEQLDRAFLPRPQGPLPAIAAGSRHPEISLPAAFEAFRGILKARGLNLAAVGQLSIPGETAAAEAIAARDGEDPLAPGHTRVSMAHLYHAGLWAAIRAGWREGYTAAAGPIRVAGGTAEEIARSTAAARETIREAAAFTKFTTDTAALFAEQADARHPAAWSDAEVAEKFESMFPADERDWLLGEFDAPLGIAGAIYQFHASQVRRLAVKFGAALRVNQELFDQVRRSKSAAAVRSFDFEPSLAGAAAPTMPKELIFWLHWLKLRGRPAQLAAPNLACEGDQLQGMAAIARHFQATLSIHHSGGQPAAVLDLIGKATAGRFNYCISGELELQLFDVLAEQPAGSRWRALYERMVERANAFAARRAFGAESGLAAECRFSKGSSLGDARSGRADGNRFLISWLGHVAGSRDTQAPDGDRRFFQEKLNELPRELLAEVRSRNAAYMTWVAEHLAG